MPTDHRFLSKIEELTAKTKNPKRELVAVDIHGKPAEIDFHHEILKVKLKNGGGEYVLDLVERNLGTMSLLFHGRHLRRSGCVASLSIVDSISTRRSHSAL
jgi:hypothetical protein